VSHRRYIGSSRIHRLLWFCTIVWHYSFAPDFASFLNQPPYNPAAKHEKRLQNEPCPPPGCRFCGPFPVVRRRGLPEQQTQACPQTEAPQFQVRNSGRPQACIQLSSNRAESNKLMPRGNQAASTTKTIVPWTCRTRVRGDHHGREQFRLSGRSRRQHLAEGYFAGLPRFRVRAFDQGVNHDDTQIAHRDPIDNSAFIYLHFLFHSQALLIERRCSLNENFTRFSLSLHGTSMN
jgi:hypothetical protein